METTDKFTKAAQKSLEITKKSLVEQIRDWMMKNAEPCEKIRVDVTAGVRGWVANIYNITYDPQCFDDPDHIIVVHSTPYGINTWSSLRNVKQGGLEDILNTLKSRKHENI